MAAPDFEDRPNGYRVKIVPMAAYVIVAIRHRQRGWLTEFYTTPSVRDKVERQMNDLFLLDAMPDKWQPLL